ncbi:tyrosine-type recombinase/integrase [Chromobacterium haemolyticum]|uniref:Tyrosine-type recombinase/integrase n=1 Tax=Chromobacterium haemolyticum TaxID=394935 RepID=A0ABS3GK56_9NEIS|nr:integrase arm-type DNA-binding domain-containing protein [Chromobacterium haemolyticum]MBK0415896.1 tyrosine-type recombinase/integrase [Chromobacterium haemolyticum]MBO0415123.1 tyrosine-type recombinase/integrase [Chromobacterium haemolyticum]MBO0498384.1 tyrosine-type recombinase/integrase [Chromobacterium haemolyticum]
MPLTDAAIKNAKPREDGKHLKLTDGQGLSLWIMPTGAKYWRLKYRINGKEKLLALGVYPEVSLKEARLKRDDARKQIADGEDPASIRKMDKVIKLAAASNTFEAIALEWHQRESHEWSVAHSERVLSAMKSHIFPYIGDRPISEIRPLELLEVLRKVESAGNIDTTKRLRQRCSAVFRLAILTGRCDNDPAAPLTDALKSQQSTPRKALMREDIPGFLEALEKYDGNLQTKLMMKLMLLTFTRVGEMAMARWEEIDFDKALWTIPPEHRKLPEKSKKTAPPHLVPLSKQALDVLRQLYAISGGREHIFPNRNSPRRPMSPETLRRALHRMGFRGKADVHGFRSTASTILNEEGFNPDAIERQLSHIETNKVRATYNRAQYMEERRKMMQWWANKLNESTK